MSTPESSWLASAWRWLRRALGGDRSRWPVYRQLLDFFEIDLDRLETHKKCYPGFDIASLNRALESFQSEVCRESRAVGALHANDLRQFFDECKTNVYTRAMRPTPPFYQRMPIDVDEEVSVATNTLYLSVLTAEKESSRERGEKVAIWLATGAAAMEAWEDLDGRHAPQQQVTISIACHSRAVADRVFRELETRRQRLSIYRGKVIDPVLHGGVIHTIGFRALKRVHADDLILPDSVRQLIHNSVIGFYDHREVLQDLGIDLKRGILLYGPPGTGKTSISLYLAGLLKQFTVCMVSGERLLYPREICRMARYLQPAMIVFEDIDLIATARDANGLATVLGELMNQIDGCEPTDQVLFLMNTNSLERLESAVRNRPGRVDQIVEIPLPDREARRRLIGHFARRVRLEVADLERVVEATAGVTPAMLKEIVKRAAVSALERNGKEPGLTVREDDLLLATEQVQAMREPIARGAIGFRDAPS